VQQKYGIYGRKITGRKGERVREGGREGRGKGKGKGGLRKLET